MGTSFRALCIESNADDLARVRHTLTAGEIECEIVPVADRAAFLAELGKRDYGLILADYALPALDGLAALALARQTCPDVPFIVVSDVPGEELAIDALKKGATDYVLKDRLARLVSAVRGALQEAAERAQREPKASLRQQAEENLRRRPGATRRKPTVKPQELTHELQVHQAELELQNEELRRAQVELAEAHDLYAELYELAPVAYLMLDRGGAIRQANFAAARMLGLERGNLPGRRFASFFTRAAQDAWHLYRQRVLESSFTQRCEVALRPHEGTPIIVKLESIRVRSGAGADERWMITLSDVTEHRRVGQALEASEARYRALVEQIPAVTYTAAIRRGRTITYVSPQIEVLIGYSPAEYVADPDIWSKALHPDDRERVRAEVARVQRIGERFASEYRLMARDGHVVWVRDEGAIIRDADTRAACLHGVLVDITERKRAEQALRESEERFRATFEQAAVGIAHVTPDGRFLRVNQRYAEIVGHTTDELRQRTIFDLTHPEDLAADVAAVQQLLAGATSTYSVEKRYARENGALVWVHLTASLVRDGQGEAEYLIEVIEDITARREAEAARQEAEERFGQVLENVSAIAIVVSSDECLTYCNPFFLALTGWNEADVRGRNWFEWFVPEDQRDAVRAVFLAGVSGGRVPRQYENEVVTRDGRRRLISWSNTPLHDAERRVIGTASLGYDITNQRRAEEAIRQERAKLRGILDAMEDAVCIVDQQHDFVYENPAFLAQFGAPEGRHCYELFHAWSEACPDCRNADVFAGQVVRWEWHCEKTGRTYDIFNTALRNEDGTFSKLEILHDITARKQTQTNLARRTRELETLVDNAPDVILRMDRQGRYAYVNRRWSEVMGMAAADVVGKTPRELGLPESLCRLGEDAYPQIVADGQMREVELELPTAIGVRRFHLRMVPEFGHEDEREPQTILVISRDITEQVQLQEELQHAQKMEVIGRLAAGIAHDINNVLTAISGYAALVQTELPHGHLAGRSLDQLEAAVQQAAGVVKGLLTFSHKTPMTRQVVDLRRAVADTVRFVKRLLPATIDVVVEGADGPPLWVSADGAQLRQVVLNLAVNSRDAMPMGGTLRFALSEERSDAGSGEQRLDSPRRAQLVVSDTGTGISAEVMSHLFEPFFTTKRPGQGTGLGLPIVKSVVEAHGGDVRVRSEPGQGAEFTICLASTEPPVVTPAEPPQVARARGRGELVLVADDNVQVLDVICAGLRQMGYDVLPVTSAPAIQAECVRYGARVRLAVLDVDLPGGSGLDALRTVRKAWPALPAVIITGNIDGDAQGASDRRTVSLQKPFRLADLLDVVTDLLQQQARAEVAS